MKQTAACLAFLPLAPLAGLLPAERGRCSRPPSAPTLASSSLSLLSLLSATGSGRNCTWPSEVGVHLRFSEYRGHVGQGQWACGNRHTSLVFLLLRLVQDERLIVGTSTGPVSVNLMNSSGSPEMLKLFSACDFFSYKEKPGAQGLARVWKGEATWGGWTVSRQGASRAGLGPRVPFPPRI